MRERKDRKHNMDTEWETMCDQENTTVTHKLYIVYTNTHRDVRTCNKCVQLYYIDTSGLNEVA